MEEIEVDVLMGGPHGGIYIRAGYDSLYHSNGTTFVRLSDVAAEYAHKRDVWVDGDGDAILLKGALPDVYLFGGWNENRCEWVYVDDEQAVFDILHSFACKGIVEGG